MLPETETAVAAEVASVVTEEAALAVVIAEAALAVETAEADAVASAEAEVAEEAEAAEAAETLLPRVLSRPSRARLSSSND